MNIPKVDTWFFEKVEFHHPSVLSIKLVEGVKSNEREMVLSDTDTPMGLISLLKFWKRVDVYESYLTKWFRSTLLMSLTLHLQKS